ncbi:MAG TPA: metal ABC transporter permease [Bacteroidia bacterium]
MFDMFQLDFMVQAFIVSLIIGILLSYLGVHVVGRGIVFVDLALGQISSLGVAFSDYVGYGKTTIPIVFALVGAFLMSLIRIKDNRLKLEAIIGIIYAIASAATVLLISKTPHGDSDIQEVLFGNILSVTWEQITTLGIVFGFIVLLHFIFQKKFLGLTRSFEEGSAEHVKWFSLWNFLFYSSIGLAIVFAVRTSGVIPVFSYLIIPSVSAILLIRNHATTIITAILISMLGGFLGLYVSYTYDFPAGSSIVAMLGVIFMAAGMINICRKLFSKKK